MVPKMSQINKMFIHILHTTKYFGDSVKPINLHSATPIIQISLTAFCNSDHHLSWCWTWISLDPLTRIFSLFMLWHHQTTNPNLGYDFICNLKWLTTKLLNQINILWSISKRERQNSKHNRLQALYEHFSIYMR